MKGRLKNTKKPKTDIQTLSEVPYINVNAIDSTNKEKREDVIVDQLIQNLPSENDRFYIEQNSKANTFKIREDTDQGAKTELVTWISATNAKLKMS